MKTNKINIEFIQEREREKEKEEREREKEERVFKRKGRIFKNVASKIIKCFSEIFRKLKNVRRKYLLIRTMVVASCNLLLEYTGCIRSMATLVIHANVSRKY